MADLAAFLRARLAEDEAAANAWLPFGNPDVTQREHAAFLRARLIARPDPLRVLREVAAKRAVLDRHEPLGDPPDYDYSGPPCGEDEHSWPCGTLRLLAAVWRDHPGYDPEWAP